MTVKELAQELKTLGYDCAYDHFNTTPTLPFIAYFENERTDFIADNKVYRKQQNITIELYTEFYEPNISEQLEDLLERLGIVYDCVPFLYIEDERMYMSSYSFSL
ncbi:MULTISPECIES: hypothetical protein [unclassified Breznakia]|uniref:hypothetical protein n=1 Tax=unclassified Breznakia TaxID=2623764 RepID=UPI0024757244|nr:MULTISPECIES: hypothetical protein [unclassified Breznakia]MDH6367136.1 hypothetical protein [Breznakia sp. PH1-1]MDH6404277.1 hypothetical protein [Breznakia sp. PF1-11]MDH6412024.1 hypothetical protein [Breznakia sp. PFB1-11]MDH6414265.1 hypothetical protein [Breznakia sp. PFB1-14]MDH6416638.1 hypothetical protein [Breznakia sp. PFB1-4]